MNVISSSPTFYDAIVIGAGVTGIYQTYLVDKEGMRVLGIEAAPDVGGTWFWNRYPGCRLDTESYAYGYFALKGILRDWSWSERFAAQPEMLRYVNAAADAMDVRRLYKFSTKVSQALYDAEDSVWRVTLDTGEVLSCRNFISATGPLSASLMPDYKGIGTFKGEAFHSSRWPTGADGNPINIDFSGKGWACSAPALPVSRSSRSLRRRPKTCSCYSERQTGVPRWGTPL